jgi:4-hydroxyphenylpyruvate dioxygenase
MALQANKESSSAAIELFTNPMGTDGFEFVEYTSREPEKIEALFRLLGFAEVAKHRSKEVTLWRQGNINFILNKEKKGQPGEFVRQHGASVNALGFRVKDAAVACRRARELGYEVVESTAGGKSELQIAALRGIGGILVYLVDRYGDKGSIYDVDFVFHKNAERHPKGMGLLYIDHLTHAVQRGEMKKWHDYYEKLFNFREIRYFDIEGKLTGLTSSALTSPDGQIRIPLIESSDDKSQVEEYLRMYNGEGIQHIALFTEDIYATVEALRKTGLSFLDTPDTYYEKIDARLPGHGEDIARMKKSRILIDGGPGTVKGRDDGGILLQIFTNTVIGPIFFEVIQRKGDEGFGEGNFKALFVALEEDQIKRGTLKA